MSKPILAFDIDGVVIDFFGPFLDFANQKLGTCLRYDECRCHDLGVAFGVSVETMKRVQREYETENRFKSPKTIDEAISSLWLLSTQYDISIVTSRKPDLELVTQQWFERNFPPASIYFSLGRNNPYAGGNSRLHKPQVCEQIGAICMFEDNEQEFQHWDSNIVEPIIFPQPWNECLVESHPHISRLNWAQIRERFLG